jgi:hypothetical protein
VVIPEGRSLEDLDINGSIKLNRGGTHWMGECELESSGSEQGLVARICEHVTFRI